MRPMLSQATQRLRQLLTRGGRPAPRHSRRAAGLVRSRLEVLESRLAPAGYAVTDDLRTLRTDGGPDGGRQVVFFEPSVADYRGLAKGLPSGTDAVALDP